MLTVLDLFAGAGGFSLGFQQAGWKIAAAVEVDPWATQTYRQNIGEHVLTADIRDISDYDFRRYSGIDAIIGGPPCQGFSISAGRHRKEKDSRNLLFREYLRAVAIARPTVVVFENVPAIRGAVAVTDELTRSLGELGYMLSQCVIDAADFGVAQRRQRYFLLGWSRGVRAVNIVPTHSKNGLSLLAQNAWVTTDEAIGDLPDVAPGALSEDALVAYDRDATTDYQRCLRSKTGVVANHIPMRHTARLIERFKHIPVGGNESDAWLNHAPRRRGGTQDTAGRLYDQNHRRISAHLPAPTITASFYSSFVHPFAARNLTVREAARLQSFPDHFRFYGKRTTLSKSLLRAKGNTEDMYLDQFNQVGNAVPPRLAGVIANSIYHALMQNSDAVYA